MTMAEPCTTTEQIAALRERVAALEAQHNSSEESLGITRNELNRRLEEMNQFRAQIGQERGEFVRRDMYDQALALLADRIAALERSKAGALGTIGAYGSIIALLMGIAALVVYWLNH